MGGGGGGVGGDRVKGGDWERGAEGGNKDVFLQGEDVTEKR
jgi:hypothetical protein